eukprot:s3556_g7.t1
MTKTHTPGDAESCAVFVFTAGSEAFALVQSCASKFPFCWHQTVFNMGASESSAPPDHATVDRVVKMATKDAVEKATVNQLWEKWEKDAESKGETLPDYVPLWWPWTRFWYGRTRPPRWVEGATIVHEDESGQLWETHVDVRLHEGRRSFVHNWTRKKVRSVC